MRIIILGFWLEDLGSGYADIFSPLTHTFSGFLPMNEKEKIEEGKGVLFLS